MTLALSTRSDLADRHGLAAFVRRVLKSGVPAVVVEAPSPERALRGTPEELAALDAPVLAFLGAPAPYEDAPETTVAAADPARRTGALTALAGAVPWMAATRCRRLLIPCGAAGLTYEIDARRRLSEPGANAAEVVRQAKALASPQRQAHAEVLCRALHGFLRAHDGLRPLLLADADPLSFLDPETVDWILNDLKGFGFALDSGAVAAGETRGGAPLSAWMAGAAGSLGFILIADHDGRGDGSLLPGAGRLDVATLRDVIGRTTPVAVRCDHRASLDDVLASVAETTRRLGPIGDPAAW